MRLRKSTYLPAALLIYMLAMAYIGRDMMNEEKTEYFCIIGASLAVIIILHFLLKKKERIKEQEADKQKGGVSN